MSTKGTIKKSLSESKIALRTSHRLGAFATGYAAG